MQINKKFFQNIFKTISYGLFKILYKKIEKVADQKNNKHIQVSYLKKNTNFEYKIYTIKEGRLYTDRINDTAVIAKNEIVEKASFQLRVENSKVFNADIKKNIVFFKGTPRLQKKINGSVLSLLTGGGGNNNYWHWLFDVLPRLALCQEIIDLKKINYFLLPNNKRRFQKETLDILNINENKQLSSENFRHILCDKLFVTSHPVVKSNDVTKDVQNIPLWISQWLKKTFTKMSDKKFSKKIYIDRSDSTSNVKHLRTIQNEDEVKNYLSQIGFESVRLGEYSFEDQVSIFHNAEIIVGLHGAGFANIVFSKPNAKIIELKKRSHAGKEIENLAKSNNLLYKYLKFDSLDTHENQFGHINVSINELKKNIN
tara:strand:+ start:76 stop:1185 length:1110 start_codon:yes stop_codon:yes gene_type:complete